MSHFRVLVSLQYFQHKLEFKHKLMLSSKDDRERILECLQLVACDYLVKPLRKNASLETSEFHAFWQSVL